MPQIEAINNQRDENNGSRSSSGDRKQRKDKVKGLTKVIIRRLPPSMTEDVFLEQIQPIPEHDDFYFVPADWTLRQHAYSRAYINFINQEDIFLFKDRFDGYVFVDKGLEYPAIVEFAPFQRLPRNKSRKRDNKCNTIESDPLFISFMEALKAQETAELGELKMEYSYQIKDEEKIKETPLLQFVEDRRQERRDDRKKRIEDKKKNREEEKSKKRSPVSKSASIQEEDDDGIIVRTVKSRPLDRGRESRSYDSKRRNDDDRRDRLERNTRSERDDKKYKDQNDTKDLRKRDDNDRAKDERDRNRDDRDHNRDDRDRNRDDRNRDDRNRDDRNRDDRNRDDRDRKDDRDRYRDDRDRNRDDRDRNREDRYRDDRDRNKDDRNRNRDDRDRKKDDRDRNRDDRYRDDDRDRYRDDRDRNRNDRYREERYRNRNDRDRYRYRDEYGRRDYDDRNRKEERDNRSDKVTGDNKTESVETDLNVKSSGKVVTNIEKPREDKIRKYSETRRDRYISKMESNMVSIDNIPEVSKIESALLNKIIERKVDAREEIKEQKEEETHQPQNVDKDDNAIPENIDQPIQSNVDNSSSKTSITQEVIEPENNTTIYNSKTDEHYSEHIISSDNKLKETCDTKPDENVENRNGLSRKTSVDDSKPDSNVETNKESTKTDLDDRTSRRIRNKDRPSIAIYQPGKRRLNIAMSSALAINASASTTVATTTAIATKSTTSTITARKDVDNKLYIRTNSKSPTEKSPSKSISVSEITEPKIPDKEPEANKVDGKDIDKLPPHTVEVTNNVSEENKTTNTDNDIKQNPDVNKDFTPQSVIETRIFTNTTIATPIITLEQPENSNEQKIPLKSLSPKLCTLETTSTIVQQDQPPPPPPVVDVRPVEKKIIRYSERRKERLSNRKDSTSDLSVNAELIRGRSSSSGAVEISSNLSDVNTEDRKDKSHLNLDTADTPKNTDDNLSAHCGNKNDVNDLSSKTEPTTSNDGLQTVSETSNNN